MKPTALQHTMLWINGPSGSHNKRLQTLFGQAYRDTLLGFILAIFAMMYSAAANAAVEASIKKHRFSFEEAIELSIHSISSLVPKLDTSSLENDFIVANIDRDSRIRNDTNPPHYENKWTVILYPKFPGNLRISPINANGEQTRAIPIQVLPIDNPTHRPLHKVELSVDKNTVAVGQPYLMTVKLLTRHPNAAVSLQWAQKPHLTPIIVGTPVTFPIKINDVDYTQNVRRLAWLLEDTQNTPDKLHHLALETTLTLPGNRKLPIQATSNTFKLDIKPDPIATAADQGFLAQGVEIRSNLKIAETLTTGIPVRHSVAITAINSDPSKLPKYTFLTKPPLIYRDHEDTVKVSNVNGQLQVSRVASASLTIQDADQATIPGWKVKWWDTEKNHWQTSVLTEQTIPLINPDHQPSEIQQEEETGWAHIIALIILVFGIGYYQYRTRHL